MKYKTKITGKFTSILLVSLLFLFLLSFNVNAEDVKGCCEQDQNNNFCSYITKEQCGFGKQWAATSCDQTSFCRVGVCSGIDGFCYENYPKALCESNQGNFNPNKNIKEVNECKLGCCIIGTQADFVTKDRCITETSVYPDLEVDFREDVTNEQQCLQLAKNTEQGCCVTDTSCSYGAKSECNSANVVNGTGFYKDTYCSTLKNVCTCGSANPELLKPGQKPNPRATMCLPNRDEVFWRDTCGNPEGIVDGGIDLKQFSGAFSNGECDYNTGTLCGDSDKDGIFVCESLDCRAGTAARVDPNDIKLSIELDTYKTTNIKGESVSRGTPLAQITKDGVLNGESWCEWDSAEQSQDAPPEISTAGRNGRDPVGSSYYRHLCINGIELVEPCKDYREEYCYSGNAQVKINDEEKDYTEARCVVNEWQSCGSCNTADPNKMDQRTYEQALKKDGECCLGANRDCSWTGNACVPAVSPGFKFWEGEGSDVCSKGNTECTAVFACGGWNALVGLCQPGEEQAGAFAAGAGLGGGGAAIGTGLALGTVAGPVAVAGILGGLLVGIDASQSGWTIVSGGECFSQPYLQASNNYCRSLGDCGADFNYLASYGEPNKFTLTDDGFSNTNNVSEEIEDYVLNNGENFYEHIGDARVEGGPEFTEKDFDFTQGVPGNLSGDPNWLAGKEFYNFITENGEASRSNFGNKLGRALLGQSVITVAGGLGGALTASFFAGGVPAAGVFFAGASQISPLGYLVTKGLGAVFEETFKDFGLGATRDAVEKKALETVLSGKTSEEFAKQQVANIPLSPAGFAQTPANDLVKLGVDPEKATELLGKDLTQEANKKALEESIQKGVESGAKKQAASSFAGYATGVSAALWAYTIFQVGDVLFEKVQPVKIETTCQPWQAPIFKATQEDRCELCNADYEKYVDEKTGNPTDVRAFKGCTEYRCKSLGTSCQLINQGSTEELCVSINKLDTNSPKIEIWEDGLSKDLVIQKSTKNIKGFVVKSKTNTDGKLKIYEPFNLALKTDEPAQCKMSFKHSNRYENMENNFFGNNIFKYFHINTMVYPATKNITTAQGVRLTGGGHYELYIRCIDAVGNANEGDFVVEFDISNEPDLTAPKIVGSSLTPAIPSGLSAQEILTNEVYLMNGANYTDVTLYLNEPALCRYSFNPVDFKQMPDAFSCSTASSQPDAPPYYKCVFNLKDSFQRIGPFGPSVVGFTSSAGLVKFVHFKCSDNVLRPHDGNFNKDAYTIVLRGSEKLNITTANPSGTIKTSGDLVNVTLQVETRGGAFLNGESVCKYTTEEPNKDNLAAMTQFAKTNSSLHTQQWNPSSGEHRFFIGCYDIAGNRDFAQIDFNVEKDASAPEIVKLYKDATFSPPQFVVEINEAGLCKDNLDGDFDFATEGNLMNAVDTSGKIFSSTVPNSDLYYIKCRDQFNNTMQRAAIIQIAEV